MAYDIKVANRLREYFTDFPDLKIEEKKMFGGLAFMVNGKMCINVSGNNLMCRFDPTFQEEISRKPGYQTVVMKGKKFKGYCYVIPEGFRTKEDFEYWIHLCLDFNKCIK